MQGSIVPINPSDDESNRVYMYNNIFYSRAIDSKDNFRICGGIEASRKMAGHDLRNQRLIQAAGHFITHISHAFLPSKNLLHEYTLTLY